MDLPPISSSAQITILAFLCLEHIIVVLLLLANFPLDFQSLRSKISHTIDKLSQIIRPSKKKQTDEEEAISAPPVERPQHQTQFHSQTLRPRWPFLSSVTSILSPRSTRDAAVTPTPSTWNGSVIRARFAGSDVTTTPTPVFAGTPVPATRDSRTEMAYTTSVSLSPYPTVTPTPIRRFMKADALYSPSVYPPLSTVKRDKGVEMLSPSVYSPVSSIVEKRDASAAICDFDGEGEDDNTIAGASRDVARAGHLNGAERRVLKEQSMLTPVARAIRPRRHFDPKREFETITPESLERGSIVIGLGGGLSPLVGTGGVIQEGLRSVSELGEELGHDDKMDGCSSVYSRALAARVESEKTKNGVELERFATPMTDDDGDKRVDHQSPRALDAAREKHQPVPLLGVLDRAIAAIATLLAKMLDDGTTPDAESGLLVQPSDLSSFVLDN